MVACCRLAKESVQTTRSRRRGLRQLMRCLDPGPWTLDPGQLMRCLVGGSMDGRRLLCSLEQQSVEECCRLCHHSWLRLEKPAHQRPEDVVQRLGRLCAAVVAHRREEVCEGCVVSLVELEQRHVIQWRVDSQYAGGGRGGWVISVTRQVVDGLRAAWVWCEIDRSRAKRASLVQAVEPRRHGAIGAEHLRELP